MKEDIRTMKSVMDKNDWYTKDVRCWKHSLPIW